MLPRIELYADEQCAWMPGALVQRFAESLEALLPELLSCPPGPDHVLSHLEVVEISLVDDAAIARVHGEFLGDPSPTDVITFPYGEILVGWETAAAYARLHGLDQGEELFRYMVHGLVHLQGYLDAAPEDRAALFAVQEPLVLRYYPGLREKRG